jgi:phosphinothricin acetyltransferase
MDNRIRSAEAADARAVQDIYAPFVSESATSFEAEPPDVPEMERRIRDVQQKHPWLVFESGGVVLGYAYASTHRARTAYQWSVEVSVYTGPRARHQGVGRALYASLFDLLRRQGYVNAYAGITLPNPASVGLHQSFGFAPIGVFPRIGYKFGKWHDVVWMQLRLQEVADPVPEPVPAKTLLGEAGIAALLQGHARQAKVG